MDDVPAAWQPGLEGRTSLQQGDYNSHFIIPRSKATCDVLVEEHLERDMCNACLDDAGDNLERGVSVNLLPPYTNARLGYVTL